MSGQLRVNEITNAAGTGAPSFPNRITPASLGTGTPTSSNYLRGDGSWSTVADATNATNATNLTGTSTANIQTSALASGTANSTTFLRGDRTWQTISTTPTTDQVLTATAGASAGAVGTYAFLLDAPVNHTVAFGGTRAGSALIPAGVRNVSTGYGVATQLISSGSAQAGTWRCLGTIQNTNQGGGVTLWLRIS